MTVTEMRQRLEEMERHGNGDDEVVVITADPSIAFTSAVPVETIAPGFDWDKGTVQIRTTRKLVKKRGGDE